METYLFYSTFLLCATICTYGQQITTIQTIRLTTTDLNISSDGYPTDFYPNYLTRTWFLQTSSPFNIYFKIYSLYLENRCCDYLKVLHGGDLIYIFQGLARKNTLYVFPFTHLTLYFTTDSLGQYPGFSLTVIRTLQQKTYPYAPCTDSFIASTTPTTLSSPLLSLWPL